MNNVSPNTLNNFLVKIRSSRKKLVFTNGCFDVLHVGHVRYLNEARSLGDVLLVGLNSDSSVKLIKGPQRPIVPEKERQEILLALKAVSYVEIFSEDNPLRLIKEVKPDILVKGGDWALEEIVGADFVKSTGGEVRCLSFVPGHSTSSLLREIKEKL